MPKSLNMLEEAVNLVGRLGGSVGGTTYAYSAFLDENPLGTYNVSEEAGTQKPPSDLSRAVEKFLGLHNGAFTVIRGSGRTIAAYGNYLAGVESTAPEYSDLFVFLGLYIVQGHRVLFRGYLAEDGDEYFYLGTKDPGMLIDFVANGYPGIRNEMWHRGKRVAVNALTLPRGDGNLRLVVKKTR